MTINSLHDSTTRTEFNPVQNQYEEVDTIVRLVLENQKRTSEDTRKAFLAAAQLSDELKKRAYLVQLSQLLMQRY